MDPKATNVLLNLTALPGLNTNAPKGTQPAPELLQNVHLDRTGGYAAMSARSRRIASVTRALSAHRGANLFTESGGVVSYWTAATGISAPLGGAITTLANSVALMPDVLLANGGLQYVTTQNIQTGSLNPGIVGSSGTVDVTWAYVDKTTLTDPPFFDATVTYDLAIEWLPTKEHPVRGVTVVQVGAGIGTPPAKFWIKLTATDASAPPHYNVYYRSGTRPYTFIGSNLSADATLTPVVKRFQPVIEVNTNPPGTNTEMLPGPALSFTVTGDTPAVYHQGRVFFAPVSVQYQRVNLDLKDAATEGVTLVTDTEPQRLYFSDVTADGREVLPAFTLLNFIDVPFRVSLKIVALASVGPYLYIFGDRELLVLTGDPERDARIENVGDSIGAISPSSVQQLSGVVYWQSDSGVLSVQGGSVKEVGEPVRDQLTMLGLNVTSTVDFKRECYYLTDGVTVLTYHARENGWTTRQVEGGGTPTLLYGGGTAYMQQGGALYSIGGESGLDGPPTKLNMRVRFPYYELGDWRTRKAFDGLAFGLDLATQNATITNRTTVDARTDQTSHTELTITAGKAGAVKLHTAKGGLNFSGLACQIDLEISTQDSRGIMRPPLTLYGRSTGEETWEDNGF